jgi:Domain of unknown function (DUF4190)
MTNQPTPNPEPWGAPPGFTAPGFIADGPPTQPGPPMPPYPAPGPYPYPPYGYYPSPPTSTLAILALVFAFVIPPAGFVLGIVGLRQIARTGEGGRGMAVAGVAVGGVFTALFVLYFVLVIIFIAGAAGSM